MLSPPPVLCLIILFSTLTFARHPIPVNKTSYPRLRLPREPTLSVFTSAVGGIPVPAITSSGNPYFPFLVAGTPITTFAKATQYSCDIQHDECAKAVQDGALTFGLGDCSAQAVVCLRMQMSAPVKCFFDVDCAGAEEAARGRAEMKVQERKWTA